MSAAQVVVIGIDCAAQPEKTGIALGHLEGGALRLIDARRGRSVGDLVETIAQWLDGAEAALLALDAPLGWPKLLAEGLHSHLAGAPLRGEPNALFRRTTDRQIYERFRKTPLDIGADRIARAARAGLELLQRVRDHTATPIPLAWVPSEGPAIRAIEVYPAATVIRAGVTLSTRGTKEERRIQDHAAKLAWLATVCELPAALQAGLHDPDVRDAAICVASGARFLTGACEAPEDQELARKEGWIWV